MRIGLIFAMDEEKSAFDNHYNEIKSNHEILTYVCGIGKVNASICTTQAIVKDKCDFIINCGVSGGINNTKQFTVIYATELAYSDADSTLINYKIGQIPQMPEKYIVKNKYNFSEAVFGGIVSQDSFATKSQQEKFETYFSEFFAVDMESCAVAQTAYVLDVEYAIVRAISDDVFKPNNYNDFHEAMETACDKAAFTTVELINQL